MEYRNLGRSGLKVSEIGLGGIPIGAKVSEQEGISVITRALDLGVNFIDTSDAYGRSEEVVGKAVKGKHSQVIIATKFGIPRGERPNECGGSRYHVIEAINASLKRLGTDYVDLYYIHWPDPTTPIEETLRALDDLVRDGKVRYIGCSNFAAWLLCEALWTSKFNNLHSFVCMQSQYNLLQRHIESELVPCCQAHGISVIPWSPLARGFLTGRYQRGKPAPAGTRLASPPPRIPSHFMAKAQLFSGLPASEAHVSILSDSNFDKLEKLQEFSAEHGHNVGELAIAWLLSHSLVSSVIAGASNPEQVSANVAAASWRLTVDEITGVEEILQI